MVPTHVSPTVSNEATFISTLSKVLNSKSVPLFGNSLDVHLAGYSETLQQVKEKGKWISGRIFKRKKNTNNTTASNKVMMPYSASKSVQ